MDRNYSRRQSKIFSNDVQKKVAFEKDTKKYTKSLMEMIKYEAKQFCLNTALHGYKFIVLSKRTLLERIIWSIIVTAFLVTALVLLVMAWLSFVSNPTLIVTDSTHHPIWHYPFPAITICNYNKISKEQVYNISRQLILPQGVSPDYVAQEMKILFQLINNNNHLIPEENYTRLQDILDTNNLQIDKLMTQLAPKCEGVLQRCKWKGEEKRCESIFEQVKSTEGFCCSFNYFGGKNHKFSGALPEKAAKTPRRVSACGYQTALEVLMDNKPDDYFATLISSIGHQVFIHNPYHFPDWTAPCLLNEMKLLNFINISPSLTYATDNIKDLLIDQRDCVFPHERQLHNLVYTHHNCLTECRMNLTKKYCGCIPFYYHNEEGTYPKSRICNLRDIQCLKKYKRFVTSSVPGFDMDNLQPNHKWGKEKSECDCMPDCEYFEYAPEASAGAFLRKYATNQQNLFGGIEIVNQSVVRLFFNDLVGTKNRRDVTYSWHTLLAYYGGILGLFVGFSFVSGFELIYFFTIRLLVDMINGTKENFLKKKKSRSNKVNSLPPVYETLDPSRLNVFNNRFEIGNKTNNHLFIN